MSDVEPYSALAAGYDAVMAHVDYPMWAAYLHRLVQHHHAEARSIAELGCGTGALAVALQPLGPGDGYRYRGVDGSDAMLAVARQTAGRLAVDASFEHGDFLDPVPGPPADVVVLVYDGLNYLLHLEEVVTLLRHVGDALAPRGIAIIDQSTPANSVNHAEGFDDVGETGAFSYRRTSAYDVERQIHTTTFTLTETASGKRVTERHVQRAYALAEVRGAIREAGLVEVAAYDGFEVDGATEASERVHWVLRAGSGV